MSRNPKLRLVKLVVEPAVREHIDHHGGAVYIWPKASRCCSAFTYTLETATTPPAKEFLRVHEEDGIEVFATRCLLEPEELHLELGRRGKLRAFWNGQAWIG